MIYEYDDNFLRKKVNDEKLQSLEDDGVLECAKLNITDEFYKKRYVKAYVYTQIAKRFIEAEGMSDKLKAYGKEIDSVYELSKSATPSGLSILSVARG